MPLLLVCLSLLAVSVVLLIGGCGAQPTPAPTVTVTATQTVSPVLSSTATVAAAPPSASPSTKPTGPPKQVFRAAAKAVQMPGHSKILGVVWMPRSQAPDNLAGVIVLVRLDYKGEVDDPVGHQYCDEISALQQKAIFTTGLKYDYCQVDIYTNGTTEADSALFTDLSYSKARTVDWTTATPDTLRKLYHSYEWYGI